MISFELAIVRVLTHATADMHYRDGVDVVPLYPGTIGTVVLEYGTTAFEVEFPTDEPGTAKLASLKHDEIELVKY